MTNTQPDQPEPPRPGDVVAALARVIAEMPAIAKDRQMGTPGDRQAYLYRGIEDILSAAAPLFGKYGIVPVPKVKRREVSTFTRASGAAWTEDHLTVTYRLYGPGDTWLKVGPFHALAHDNSDKGINKALTQAFKQMLVQVLMIGDSRDDPDSYGAIEDRIRPPERSPEDQANDHARTLGWADESHRMTAHREAHEFLTGLVSADKLTAARAGELWREYQRPDGSERASPRSTASHGAFLILVREEAGLTSPAPSDTPADPETPADPIHSDNGYRDDLDEQFAAYGHDPGWLTTLLTAWDAYRVVDALAVRGFTGQVPVEDLRPTLVGMILQRAVNDRVTTGRDAPGATSAETATDGPENPDQVTDESAPPSGDGATVTEPPRRSRRRPSDTT